MATFDVVANASYQTHRNRPRLLEDAAAYFSGLGFEVWSINPLTSDSDILRFGFRPLGEVEQAVTQQDCDAFMAQHDNSGQTEGQQIEVVASGALATAEAIPGWATWTEAEVLAWFQTNIQDTLDALPPDIDAMTNTAYTNNAKAIAGAMQDILNNMALMCRNMGRMEVALRNKQWPHLEGSD